MSQKISFKKEVSTKEKIFDVAIELFSKKGYNGVSIREIAKNVGIKESSIYNHYKGKEAILNSILDYFMDEMKKDEIPLEIVGMSLDDGFNHFYDAGADLYKSKFENPKMMKIMRLICIEAYHNDKMRNFFNNEVIALPISGWTGIFTLMQEKGLIRDDANCKELAESFYYYGMFLLVNYFVFNYDESYDFMSELFSKMEKQMELIFNSVRV